MHCAAAGGVGGPAGRGCYDRLTDAGRRDTVDAGELLRVLLDAFAPIWFTGSVLHGVPLGDVWSHPLGGR